MEDDGRPAILPQEITIRREDKIRQSKIDIHEFIERARTDVRIFPYAPNVFKNALSFGDQSPACSFYNPSQPSHHY